MLAKLYSYPPNIETSPLNHWSYDKDPPEL